MFTARNQPSYKRHAGACFLLGALFFAFSLTACNNDQQQRQYCDQTGCYACMGNQCYPIPGNPSMPAPNQANACNNDSDCPSGQVCNLGTCQAGCKMDSDCQSGDTCISGRCRPGGSASCGTAGAFCVADKDCGSARSCVAGACAAACADTSTCALGQVCNKTACVDDPSPKTAQCLFDIDCAAGAGGFRCVNAYCLKNCAAPTDCSGGASCIKGTCRADKRPAQG